MKEIVVLSGKGGTGKTSIVGSLAALSQGKVLADCDVYAADLHLLLKPVTQERYEFWSERVFFIDEENCIQCGRCEEVCRFKAINDVINNCKIDSIACEGCGFCYHNCREEAITILENLSGNWFISSTKYGTLVHAKMGPVQKNSDTLITLVRQQAKLFAEKQGLDYIISDGPPGAGGPAIASLSGASLALLIAEPTLSGINGLDRVISVCHQFNVPALVCINKYDLNEDHTRQIESHCRSRGIEVVARIPFDNAVTQAMVQGLPVVKYTESSVSQQIKALWESISRALY